MGLSYSAYIACKAVLLDIRLALGDMRSLKNHFGLYNV